MEGAGNDISRKSLFQVYEARAETVKLNSSWQQQEENICVFKAGKFLH